MTSTRVVLGSFWLAASSIVLSSGMEIALGAMSQILSLKSRLALMKIRSGRYGFCSPDKSEMEGP